MYIVCVDFFLQAPAVRYHQLRYEIE